MSEPSPHRAWMTPFLNRIADIAGERAAVLLGSEMACRKIKIPKTVTSDHWLAQLVGLDAAEKLAEAYPGQHLTIPPVLVGSKRRRAKAIADLTAEGLSLNKTAAILGIARSTVIEHRARLGKPGPNPSKPDDEDQGSLF